MAAKRIEIDETGRTVATNITVRRARARLSVAELAERVRAHGRALTRQALSEIEAGRRRVDVDDLIALAMALNTSPATLLMPEAPAPDESVGLIGPFRTHASVIWRWLTAAGDLEVGTGSVEDLGDHADRDAWFARDAAPAWARSDV